MILSELMNAIDYTETVNRTGVNPSEIDILSLSADSRTVLNGSMFVCISGALTDGHDYIDIAYHRGCRVFVTAHETKLPDDAFVIGFLHDIGNLVNRKDHSLSGAVMAWSILHDMGCDPGEMATIVTAIGNHDEGTGVPVNAVAAALILADKADVRWTRVRNQDISTFDIHDRVNYSVKKSMLKINEDKTIVKLKLTVDAKFGSVMDYFEIFMQRMILCRKAAEKLGLQFKLIINEQQLI